SMTLFAQGSYNYTVQEGDNWDAVASRTGVSVEALQEANPEAAARENGWLLVGETLVIPSSLSQTPRTHTVRAGESWASIAEAYGIPVSLLRAANPQAIRTGNILYRGEQLIIPPVGASERPPDPTSTEAADEEATAEMAEEETPEATPTPEEEMSAPE